MILENSKCLIAGLLCALLVPKVASAQALIDVYDEDAIREMTEQSFHNFKDNKWGYIQTSESGDQFYVWGWKTKDGDGYRYYWEQNLCMMALAALAEYSSVSVEAKAMSELNTDGFTDKYNHNPEHKWGTSWNEFTDDLGWALDSYLLAYRHSRKKAYLDAAIVIFNTAFTRGNLGPTERWENTIKDGREGLWWRVPPSRWKSTNATATQGTEGAGYEVKNQDHYKSPLGVSPVIQGGAMLYIITQDKTYLDKAEKLWEWTINTIWEKSDKGIYEGWNCALEQRKDEDGWGARNEGYRGQQKLHHVGTFLEATNILWKATGEERYYAWCWKMVNSVLLYRLDNYGIIKNVFDSKDGSWCWEFGRGMTNFCADNNLWDFKGQVPLIEGEYVDFKGETKTYTTKANGALKSFPNGWTMYQWMAASASRIKDNNATCIVLPTNRDADVWFDLKIKGSNNMTLEAEEATLSGNAVAGNDLQASGGQTVTMDAGSWIEFVCPQNEEGNANIDIIYASAEDRKLSLLVNGNPIGTYDCPATGTGYKMRNGSDTLHITTFLFEGDNVIKLGSDTEACPTLDKIIIKKVKGENVKTVLDLEAEEGTPMGAAEIGNDLQASGGKVVKALGSGSWLSFTYNAPLDGNYELTIQYISAEDRPLSAVVNDGVPTTQTCKATGGDKARNGVGDVTFTLQLAAGENIIKLGHDTETAPILDKMSIKLISIGTDIEPIITQQTKQTSLSGWYNLNGQRLSEAPSKQGIYIHDGKKVIIYK